MRRALWILPLALITVAALVWSQRRAEPFFVSGFVEADETRVGSPVGGRVREVLVSEGQRVTAGQHLVRLEPFDLTERLRQAEANLAARQAVLAKLEAGFRTEEVQQARARRDRHKAVLERLVAGPRPLEIQILQDKLELARADLVNAESEHARMRKLHEEGRAATQEMDNAIRLLATAQARFAVARDELALAKEGTRAEEIAEAQAALAEAEQALALLEAGYRPEEIAESRANVEAAEALMAAIQRQIEELTILAPMDGVVEAVDLLPGDLLAAGAPVISLLDTGRLYVRAYVPQNRLHVAVGQNVAVRVDSYRGRRFGGRVTFVSREAEFTPSNAQTPEERSKLVFRIKVALVEGLDVLRAGMAADVLLADRVGER